MALFLIEYCIRGEESTHRFVTQCEYPEEAQNIFAAYVVQHELKPRGQGADAIVKRITGEELEQIRKETSKERLVEMNVAVINR